jgi:FAD/FMN-containing dehydrogenase
MSLTNDLSRIISGEIEDTAETLENYSHDASLFEVKPQVVVYPKNAADVKALVKYAKDHKTKDSNLSITARSAGTDMSGGAVNDSIVADFNRHFTEIFEITDKAAHAQPGVFYRDFEKATFEHGALMPSYPASRDLCTIGGMVNNNSGGEKSLEFGKTQNFVTKLDVVFADGNEYTVGPLTKAQLDVKMQLTTFEGEVCYQSCKTACLKEFHGLQYLGYMGP